MLLQKAVPFMILTFLTSPNFAAPGMVKHRIDFTFRLTPRTHDSNREEEKKHFSKLDG